MDIESTIVKYNIPISLESYMAGSSLRTLASQVTELNLANILETDYLEMITLFFENQITNEGKVDTYNGINHAQSYLDFLNEFVIGNISKLLELSDGSEVTLDYNSENLQETKNVAMALYHFLVVNRTTNINDFFTNIIIAKKDELLQHIKDVLNKDNDTAADQFIKELDYTNKIDIETVLLNIHVNEVIDCILLNMLNYDTFREFCLKYDEDRIDSYFLLDQDIEISSNILQHYFNTTVKNDYVSWKLRIVINRAIALAVAQ